MAQDLKTVIQDEAALLVADEITDIPALTDNGHRGAVAYCDGLGWQENGITDSPDGCLITFLKRADSPTFLKGERAEVGHFGHFLKC